MKKKVAIYARASKETGTENGDKQNSTESQVEDIRRLCHARGHLVVKVFPEVGSRVDDKREKYNEMMEFARQGKCDIIAVWKIDRLGGSTRQLLNCVGDLADWGVNIISYADSIDTTTEMGKVFFELCAIFSKIEYNNTVKRIRWGVEKAQKHGTKSGKPFGRPVVEQDVVRTVLRLMDEPGVTPKQIQKRAPVSKGTYYKILKVKKAMRGGKELTKDWLKENQISSRLHQRILRSYQNLYSVEK